LSTGFKQIRKVKKLIDEKLANATASFNSENHKWEYDASVEFYTGLKKWLYEISRAGSLIECFNADNIHGYIDEFECLMADLVEAEQKNDVMDIGISRNMIRALIDQSNSKS
jgi:hypothetical protein